MPDSTDLEASSLTAHLAAVIRSFRIRAGWSARQLAELCHEAGAPGLTRSTIAKIESNVRAFITVEELDTLAKVFGVPAEILVRRDGVAPAVRSTGTPVELRGTGLIGRVAERRQMIEWLVSAANHQPVTVLVEGEPGIGKTSLIAWLAEEAARRKALVLSGACMELSSGVSMPYGALTEALRLFVRQEGSEQAMLLAGRAWSTLRGLVGDSVGGEAPTTAEHQIRVFSSVLRFADQIQRRGPLVLIFEDVHWADPATLDLIRYLTRVKTDQQLMLVCSYRPLSSRNQLRAMLGEQDFLRRVHRICLAPFNESESNAFVAALSGRSVRDDRLKHYFELSGGNPYYAGQLVMADDPDTPEVEVPQSLRDQMMSRLAQLSDDAVEVVRIAAVAGPSLSEGLLTAVSRLDEPSLERALLECVGQQILIRDGTADAYTFQHAVLRHTAYKQILPLSRKRIHGRIAEALSAPPNADTGLEPQVAHHWFEAGRAPEALAAVIRAAEHAVRRNAFSEAVAQFERALRLWPDITDAHLFAGGSKDRILEPAAAAARWAGDLPMALRWIRQAVAEVDAQADPLRGGELRERLGSCLWDAGAFDESVAAYRDAQRLMSALPAGAVASRVNSALATVAIREGDYSAGLDRARLAADQARAVDARAEEGRALNSMGLALAFGGQNDEGEKSLRSALAIAAEAGHQEDILRAYANLGACLEDGGRLSDAVAVLAAGLAWAKDNGLLKARRYDVLANNAAAALSLLGRYQEAASLLDPVLLARSAAESPYARLTRAEVHIAQGGYADARRLLEQIRDLANADPRFSGVFYGCLAEVAAGQDRIGEAREAVKEGVEAIDRARNARIAVQLCATGLRIAADRGDVAWADELLAVVRRVSAGSPGLDQVGLLTRLCDAERSRSVAQDTAGMWSEIAAGWDALGQPLRKAYAQSRFAVAAARSGARDQAGVAFREAHATAEEIGAEPLRAQIETQTHALRLRLGKPRPYNLTSTELKVLSELVTGRRYSEIAAVLSISPNTVSVHVSNILRKLGVRGRAEAQDLARREELLSDR